MYGKFSFVYKAVNDDLEPEEYLENLLTYNRYIITGLLKLLNCTCKSSAFLWLEIYCKKVIKSSDLWSRQEIET